MGPRSAFAATYISGDANCTLRRLQPPALKHVTFFAGDIPVESSVLEKDELRLLRPKHGSC